MSEIWSFKMRKAKNKKQTKPKKSKLPEFLRPYFWSYKFSSLDPLKHKKLIVLQLLNYGRLKEWRWLKNTYGEKEIKKIIKETPASEFNSRTLKLILLLFKAKKPKYASRSVRFKSKKNF